MAIFEAASVVLVVAGIVGELWVGIKSGNKNAEHRSKSARLIGLVREKAGNAEKVAADANQRAATMELQAATLRKRAEDEALARVQIENRLARRRVTKEQHDRYVSILRPFRGSRVEGISVTDIETRTFREEILNVFRDAGWNAPFGIDGNFRPIYGVECAVDARTAAGNALAVVLKQLPSAKVAMQNQQIPVSEVALGYCSIGMKPPYNKPPEHRP